MNRLATRSANVDIVLTVTGIDVERRLHGTGTLVFANGSNVPIGPFRIEQNTSGRTLLYCQRTTPVLLSARSGNLDSFRGQTTAGQPIQTHGGFTGWIDTPKEFCFMLRNVEVGQAMPDGHTHDLSLTNLHFPLENPGLISFTVPWGITTVPVRLIPRRNYQERITQLTKTRGIIPTTTLRFHSADLAGNALTDFITDLCHTLSLIQGGKTNWIYHATYGPQRSFQNAVFGGTITKADTAQPLCFIPTTRSAVTLALEAVKDALPAIKHFRQTFDRNNRLINAWLDARTETDYLEGRTLKYVVVIEALVALTTRAGKTKSIVMTVHDPTAWKQLYENHIISALPAETANWLTLPRWQSLNASSFRDKFAAACSLHSIAVSPQDVTLFSRVRNAIVHRFDYDYDIPLPSQWNMPSHPQAALHFFTAEFVDRIILQLFGLRIHLQSSSTGSN